jgi:hypothetical protein
MLRCRRRSRAKGLHTKLVRLQPEWKKRIGLKNQLGSAEEMINRAANLLSAFDDILQRIVLRLKIKEVL